MDALTYGATDTLLSQLFIVSEVSLENNKDVTSGHDWTFSDIFPLPGA